MRTFKNPVQANFREFLFPVVGWIVGREKSLTKVVDKPPLRQRLRPTW
jgi:hypothetical protein